MTRIASSRSSPRSLVGDRPDREARDAELGAGELPVIGRRMRGRFFVEGTRRAGSVVAGRLGGASLPIGGAGARHRRLGDAGGLREMSRGEDRVVQEPQRDPAGMELGLDLHRAGLGGMVRANPVGGARIAEIENLAGDKPPLDPPFVAVDDRDRVARGREQDIGRLADLVGPAQHLDLREEIAGVGAQRRRHRGHSRSLGASALTEARALASARTSAPARLAARIAAAVCPAL